MKSTRTLLFLFIILLLLSVFPVFRRHTVSGRLYTDPSSLHHLYIDEYDLDLIGFDSEETTYFFLPSHVKLERIDQTGSPCTVLCTDGSVLSNPPLNEIIPVFVSDGYSDPSPWKISFMKSENLYSIFINTKGNGIENVAHDTYLPSSAIVYSPTGALTYTNNIELKGRGNATWDDPAETKVPFQIRLPQKSSLCNLESSDKWALLANRYDATHILNKMAFDTGRKINMINTTDSDWVDLFIDGEYLGNYLLCKEPDEYIKGDNAFLIEKNDIYYDMKPYGFKTTHDAFTIKNPAAPTKEQLHTLQSFVSQVDSSIYSNVPDKFSLIDSASFARWYMTEEVFLNTDALITSCYFHTYGDDILYAGPLWDFDSSLGEDGGKWLDYTGTIRSETVLRAPLGLEWYNLLYDDPKFRSTLFSCYKESLPVFEQLLSDGIDDYYDHISASLKMDSIVWPRNGIHASTVPGYYNDPYNNFRFAKYFIYHRLLYLNDEWHCPAEIPEPAIYENSSHLVEFRYPDGTVYSVMVKDGDVISEDELPAFDKDIYLGWCYSDNEMPLYSTVPVFEDVSFYLLEK